MLFVQGRDVQQLKILFTCFYSDVKMNIREDITEVFENAF